MIPTAEIIPISRYIDSNHQLCDTETYPLHLLGRRRYGLVNRIFDGLIVITRSDFADTRVNKDKSGCPACVPNDVGAARLQTWLYHSSRYREAP